MKLSLKLQDDHHHHQQANPVVTAKVPISILNQPFLSSVSTASLASSLSFSLSSNFDSGPSLKLSYSPTTTTTNTSSSSSSSLSPPFSLSLKSGLGLFGSPNHSPLVFKAHFSFSSPNPTFSLHFKPQFGHFSLKKTIFSNPRGALPSGSAPKPGNDENSGPGSGSGGGEVGDGSAVWQEVKLEPCGGGFGENCEAGLGPKRGERGRVLEGIAVMARTVFPVGKRAAVSVRWGVNLPAELGARMPNLTMNKIAIERGGEEGRRRGRRGSGEGGNAGDLELLKGMCYWMTRDLEALERESREMKRSLEEISKLGAWKGKCSPPMQPNSGSRVVPATEGWKSRKNGKEESVRREVKKPSSAASDLESELQRAIAVAAGSSG